MFRRIKNRFLRYLAIFIYFVILFFCAIEVNFLNLFGHAPDIVEIRNPIMSVGSQVYTADGKLIGQYVRQDRSPVTYNEISLNLITALIATEDVRFYKPHGIDLIGFMSSMVSTVTGEKRGGSTITQQLAKNLF